VLSPLIVLSPKVAILQYGSINRQAPGEQQPSYVQPASLPNPIMSSRGLSVTGGMVFVLGKEVFISAVGSEGYCCNTETRKGALESVPPGELSCVSPSLSVVSQSDFVIALDIPGELVERTLSPMGRIVAGQLRQQTCARRSP
jgi:hypothetical protein